MTKLALYFAFMFTALTVSVSVHGQSRAPLFPTTPEVMAHLKSVGPYPQESPSKGLVYYKCGHNPVDVLTGQPKDLSSQEFYDYYAITRLQRKRRESEIVGLKLIVSTLRPTHVRLADGAHTTRFVKRVTVERVLTWFGPGHNLRHGEELLTDLVDRNGFSGQGEMVLVRLGFRERSRCIPTSPVAGEELTF